MIRTLLASSQASDLGGTALETLGARYAALRPDGHVVWRTDRFAQALPELGQGTSLNALGPPLESLARAVAALEAGEVEATAVIACRSTRRVYDARVVRGAALVFVELQDATERQQAQQRHLADRERLLLTSRVMSVGELASMLAHELNQPIGSVVNLLRGLRARLGRGALDPESADQMLAKAAEQALYASAVIARVRAFVDQRQPVVEPLDLARVAKSTVDLLDWELTRDGARVIADLPAGLPPVLGDEVMVQQVLVNLARNALDAMRATAGAARELRLAARLNADANMVELTVADTGPGVSEEAVARLFSPFFSTKSGGMGVGLGICRSIVELHRGRLWFTPGAPVGSEFHIALPVAPGACSGERRP